MAQDEYRRGVSEGLHLRSLPGNGTRGRDSGLERSAEAPVEHLSIKQRLLAWLRPMPCPKCGRAPLITWNSVSFCGQIECEQDCIAPIFGPMTRYHLIRLWNQNAIAQAKNYPRPAL